MESINQIQSFADTYERIRAAIAREMIGQEQVVQELLLCLVAGGNVPMCWTCPFPAFSSRLT